MLKLLQKLEELFDGTLGTCKTDPANFELKRELESNMIANIFSTKGKQGS